MTREESERVGRLLRRRARREQLLAALARWIRQPVNRMRKARPIVWEQDAGTTCPCCPRCHEPAYSTEKCVFCGQRFIRP